MGSMWKGFLAGTLTLVAIYVVVQPNASRRTGEASNAIVDGMRRLMSPQVAGIGDHSKTTPTGGARQGSRASQTLAPQESSQGTLFT
jgi:cell division septation protein DedD